MLHVKCKKCKGLVVYAGSVKHAFTIFKTLFKQDIEITQNKEEIQSDEEIGFRQSSSTWCDSSKCRSRILACKTIDDMIRYIYGKSDDCKYIHF